ncbi:MAG TPA: AEC family transporter [Prolixibacteraceae bacterium]|nr:AEC family transporter [Prolixibacteraceae bacterium]
MDSLFSAFQSIAPLFLVIFAGIVVSRNKSVNNQWIEILNNYALWIGFPALILVALSRLQWDYQLYSNLILTNSIRLVVSIFLVLPFAALLKLENKMRRTLFLAVSFGNVAYLGIPVLRSAYGDQILPEATMISAVYLIWLFTLGIFMVEYFGEEKVSLRKLLIRLITNPMLVAVVIGLIVAINHFQLPLIMMSGLDIFAGSVTGVVLFSLGLFVGKQPLGKFRDWLPVLAFSVVILFVLPFVFLLISGMFFDRTMSRAWILETAMPLGLTPYALSVKYNLNTEFTSRVVVLSTSMALISLPLWLVFLQ